MQLCITTLQNVSRRPGYGGTGKPCLSADKRTARVMLVNNVHGLTINNDLFAAYENDLDMT